MNYLHDPILFTIYQKCVGAFGRSDLLAFHAHAVKMYEQGAQNFGLKYHVWDHARGVVIIANFLAGPWLEADDRAALTLAAMFHDVVYVPGIASPSNEAASCAALLAFATRAFSLTSRQTDILKKASSLIQATQIENHLRPTQVDDLLEGALLDADLKAFYKPQRVFYRLQRQIRMEADYRSDLETCKKHAEFLQKLLSARDYLYHTQVARTLWEDTARRNVDAWCNEHGFTKPSKQPSQTLSHSGAVGLASKPEPQAQKALK